MDERLNEFLFVRDILKKEQPEYSQPGVEVGDFTYGVPQIEGLDEGASLKIGKFCSISHDVTIMLGGNHRPDWNSMYPFNAFIPSYSYITGSSTTKGDVIIGNDVWIASGVKIMSGVKIADGCVIGANALVTRDTEPYSIVGGVPAKLIKKRFSDDIIQRFIEMQWWDWKAKFISDAIPILQSGDIDGLFDYYQTVVKKDQ